MKAKDNKTDRVWAGALAKIFVRNGRATAMTEEEEKELDDLKTAKNKELAAKKSAKKVTKKSGRPKKVK